MRLQLDNAMGGFQHPTLKWMDRPGQRPKLGGDHFVPGPMGAKRMLLATPLHSVKNH